MQPIGERLEEARKRKGVSLREAAEATKIRGDYLHKFENNQFDIKLPEIYVRGFLRSYAGYLKLSPDKISADYDELGYGETRASPRMPSREVYGRMDLSVASSHGAADGKSAGAMEEPSPEPAQTPRRMPQTFRGPPAAMPGPQINIDQVAKFVALAAIVIVVLGFLLWGIKSLVGGGHPQKPAVTVESAPAQPSATERSITLVALDTVSVTIAQKNPDGSAGNILFQGTLLRGQRQTVPWPGPIYISANAGERLTIEYKGKQYPTRFTGAGRAQMN